MSNCYLQKANITFNVDDIIRFWSKVDTITSECWLWNKGRFESGYGQFFMSGRPIAAHRASWLIVNGDIAEGQQVLHTCDNPPCVNPQHLFQWEQIGESAMLPMPPSIWILQI